MTKKEYIQKEVSAMLEAKMVNVVDLAQIRYEAELLALTGYFDDEEKIYRE